MESVTCNTERYLKNNTRKAFFSSALLFMMLVHIPGVFAQEEEGVNIVPVPPAPYTLYKEGKYQEAITAADELIEKDINNISAYAVKGRALLSIGQWKNALQAGKDGEKRNANDPRFVAIIGESYYELHNDEEAKKYLSRYLVLLPKGQLRDWTYYFLGNIYARNDQWHKADIAFNTAISLNGGKVGWLLALGEVYDTQKRFKESEKIYKQVLEIDASNSVATRKIQQINTN